MEHRFFKPRTLEDAKGWILSSHENASTEERWETETPIFSQHILKYAKDNFRILDYGCGIGRLAKEILLQNATVSVVGLDDSSVMLMQAPYYVMNKRFSTVRPKDLEGMFDVIYNIYVMQHIPAIEIRDSLRRMYSHLKDEGVLIYCSSNFRHAIRFDDKIEFFDDSFLGVNLYEELTNFFDVIEPLFSREVLDSNPLLKNIIEGSEIREDKTFLIPHYALVCRKKKGIC